MIATAPVVSARANKDATKQGLPYHPLADIFPLIEGGEFEELVADIKANGLRERIVLHQGMILDGRNRYRACIESGLFKPTSKSSAHLEDRKHFISLPSNMDAVSFVISKNIHRRHLDESQRATAAAKLANMRQGERTDREPSANLQKVSQADAARLLSVSERTVADAAKVLKRGTPEIVQAVASGKLKVSQAASAAELDPADQQEVARDAMKGDKKSATKKIKQAKAKKAKSPKKKAPAGNADNQIPLHERIITSDLKHAVRGLALLSDEFALECSRIRGGDRGLRSSRPHQVRDGTGPSSQGV
jgi:ParB-like chromosome segregation protein Spo0J